MKQRPAFLIYATHGIQDPLFRGLLLEYLRRVNGREIKYQFHIITYEQAAYAADAAEELAFRALCAESGFCWYPIRYRKVERGVLLYRLWEFLQALWLCVRIRARFRVRAVLGYLPLAGAYGFIVSRLLGIPLVVYCFEPHSAYQVDFGFWRKGSLSYQLLSSLERLQATMATYLVVPTHHTMALVKGWQPRAKGIFRVPISVDTDKFRFLPEARTSLRAELGMDGRRVVLYLGKFGGLYYSVEEVARFSAMMYTRDPNLFFFTITPDPTADVAAAYQAAGLPTTAFLVHPKIPYHLVSDYLSAADIGLVSIPPLPSQKYRTPVKVGNYLAAGLPYIITAGVGDDDALAREEGVGAVFESFSAEHFAEGWKAIEKIFSEDRPTLLEKCRKIGVKERGLSEAEHTLHYIFEALSQ
ncbi:MAG: glycosyltransferase [Bernardetiaceae bacterium]